MLLLFETICGVWLALEFLVSVVVLGFLPQEPLDPRGGRSHPNNPYRGYLGSVWR